MLTNFTGAGANVFSARETTLWKPELPAILIYAREEHSEPLDTTTNSLKRKLSLAIEIRAESNSNLDDALDDIAVQVEGLMNADPTLQGKALNSLLIQTEIETSAESEKPIGAARLTYEVLYTT